MLLLSTKRQQKLFYKVRFIKTPIFINRNKQESDFCIVFTADSNLAFCVCYGNHERAKNLPDNSDFSIKKGCAMIFKARKSFITAKKDVLMSSDVVIQMVTMIYGD